MRDCINSLNNEEGLGFKNGRRSERTVAVFLTFLLELEEILHVQLGVLDLYVLL